MRPWRRGLSLGLATWLTALTGCTVLPQKSPDQLTAALPPDLIAVKRKDLANSLMTGFLAYQFLKPYADAACQPTTPGGPMPAPECYELAGLDGQLKTVWDQFWNAIFEWQPGAGAPQTDWGRILDTILSLLLKVAGKAVMGVRPGMLPPRLPAIPQLAPRTMLDSVAPVGYIEPPRVAIPIPSHEDVLPADPETLRQVEQIIATWRHPVPPIAGIDTEPYLVRGRSFHVTVVSDR